MLYCASFESYIRQNFGFFPVLTRIVCCLANARQQLRIVAEASSLTLVPSSFHVIKSQMLLSAHGDYDSNFKISNLSIRPLHAGLTS